MKYLICENYNLSGFGNQLRAIAGWYFLAQLLNRQLVIKNRAFNTLFKSPYSNGDFSYNFSSSQCINVEDISSWYDLDLNSLDVPFLVAGGGRPMIYDLQQHKIHGKQLNSYLDSHNIPRGHDVARRHAYKFLIEGFKDDLPPLGGLHDCHRHAAHYNYQCIQFRSFFDAGYSGIDNVDKVLNKADSFLSRSPDSLDTYILSDSHPLGVYVNHQLSNRYPARNFYCEKRSSCSSCKGTSATLHSGFLVDASLAPKSYIKQWEECAVSTILSSLDGWRLLANSCAVLSSSTSFSQSACEIFNIPSYDLS